MINSKKETGKSSERLLLLDVMDRNNKDGHQNFSPE